MRIVKLCVGSNSVEAILQLDLSIVKEINTSDCVLHITASQNIKLYTCYFCYIYLRNYKKLNPSNLYINIIFL